MYEKGHLLVVSVSYPLYYCESSSKAINLTIDQELLSGFGWFHIVESTSGPTFVCNVLTI